MELKLKLKNNKLYIDKLKHKYYSIETIRTKSHSTYTSLILKMNRNLQLNIVEKTLNVPRNNKDVLENHIIIIWNIGFHKDMMISQKNSIEIMQ